MMGSEVMVVLIAVGIPVVCATLIVLEAMKRKDQRRRMKSDSVRMQDRESEIIEEIYRGLKALRSRIENLETIYKEKGNRE